MDAAEQAKAHIKIALLHHPFDWLREFDQKDSAALLLDNCDFVLHGHLHQSALTQLSNPDSSAMMIAGGACYETREYPNSYNFVQLDLGAGTGEVYLRRYSDERGGFWAKDTLTYKNVSDGVFTFRLNFSFQIDVSLPWKSKKNKTSTNFSDRSNFRQNNSQSPASAESPAPADLRQRCEQYEVRQLLETVFDNDELEAFCSDHFKEVSKKFSGGMSPIQKLTKLLDYCYATPTRFESLIRAMDIMNKPEFKEFLRKRELA